MLRQFALGAAFDKIAQRHVDGQRGQRQHQRGGQRHDQASTKIERQIERKQPADQRQPQRQRAPDRQHGQADGKHGAQQQQQGHFIAGGIVGPRGNAAVEHAGDQVGVHFNAGVRLAHRRGAQVHQARRGEAQQRVTALELGGREVAFKHVDGRDVAKRPAVRPAWSAVGHEGGAARVEGHLQHLRATAQHDRRHRAARRAADAAHLQRRLAPPQAQHGQRQRFVERAVKPGNERHGAHLAVRIGHRVEEAGGRRRSRQGRDVAAVAVPLQHAGRQGIHLRQWARQRARAARVAVTAEVVAQRHRAALQRRGQHAVVVERRRRAGQPICKRGVAAQVFTCQLLQVLQAGAAIRLGKHHVHAQCGHLLTFEQLAHQCGHAGAAPGPLAQPRQAALVDVDNDHALVERAGHGQLQAPVVQGFVQALQRREAPYSGSVQYGQQHQRCGGQRAFAMAPKARPEPAGRARCRARAQRSTNSRRMPPRSI